jgi:hypothetical protein
MEVLQFGDQVVLQEQYLEMSTGSIQELNSLDVLLMQRQLLQGRYAALIMFRSLGQEQELSL